MKRFTMSVLCLMQGCLWGCGVEGLHNANPKTIVRVDPMNREVYVYNNKDVDIDLKKPSFTAGSASFSADSLVITDKASVVREANYTQMQGMALQAQVNWAGANGMIERLTNLISVVMPYVPKAIAANALGQLGGGGISTPWGGYTGGGLSDAQIKALLETAGTKATTKAE